jgi:hypothetical protein
MSETTMISQTFRRSILVLLLLVLVALTSADWSQVNAGGEEWRPVEAADVALKAAVVESNADAEAIFWDIRIDDGGQDDLVLSHYVRIKIFTERGRDQHSKIDIPYLQGIKIKDVAARTIRADGSIVELAKEDIIEKTVVKVSGLKLRTAQAAHKNVCVPGHRAGRNHRVQVEGSQVQHVRQPHAATVPARHPGPVGDVSDKALLRKRKTGLW